MTETGQCEYGTVASADSAHEQVHGKHAAESTGLCMTFLADMPRETLLDAAALSRNLAVSTRTLRRMVISGQLPQGIRLGGRPMWMVGKVLEYLTVEAERRMAEARRTAARLGIVRG